MAERVISESDFRTRTRRTAPIADVAPVQRYDESNDPKGLGEAGFVTAGDEAVVTPRMREREADAVKVDERERDLEYERQQQAEKAAKAQAKAGKEASK